ncbi:MAG: histidine phosphatase family protein [Coriobacteriales bacterium]|nr:histidine phosphatase family protein [Coriobacteriales bacterium]
MRVVLMRHGQTAGNAQRCYVGRRTDEPLSAEGRAQCARAGTLDQVRTVYVSPLLRTRQTAGLCFPSATQVVVDDLAECDFGAFEGRSAQDMEHDPAYRAWVAGGCTERCPGGESPDDHARRTCAALEHLVRDAMARGERALFVVAHGGTVMATLSMLGPRALGTGTNPATDAGGYFSWHVGNCEGYVATVRLDAGRVLLGDPRRFTHLSEASGFLDGES